jgi:glycosyltransferase involved in cell wall biosynthesis
MESSWKPYVSTDLAVIIPTKDRPDKIHRLLQSIISLDCDVGRIIIVASGQDIRDTVISFTDDLSVEYHTCGTGQIQQRNKGIALLDDRTRLVATMDDDALFHTGSVTEMIQFWNNVETETAGVGFNISNQPSHCYNWLRGLFRVSVPDPGRVLKSGSSTPISNIKKNIRSEWLNGGGTVWRQEILKQYQHKEVRSKWAVCEDLIFSYPLGLIYPLYVCKTATIEIDNVMISEQTPELYRYRGRTHVLWGLYFVLSNHQLSLVQFYYKKHFEIVTSLLKVILWREYDKIYLVFGMTYGLYLSMKCLIGQKNIIEIIEEHT